MTSRVTESTKHPHPPGHGSDRPPSPPDPESSIPAHILIVDDDPIVLTAMETLLDGPNRIIVKAETGQDALRHLLRHDFAVVLLDVRMPRLGGYETAALVRQRERSRFTPIIFLSGVDTLDADVVRGLTSGAVDYLVKPVVPEILKNKVSVFVDLYRLRERVKQQAVRQSEERFRLLVEGVQDYAIFLLDREGLVTTWNIGAERLTGYRSTDILGRHYECFYPNEEVASGQPASDLQMAAAEGSRAEQDRWMVRKDSIRFIANVVVTGLRDEPGNLQGYAVVIRDVTERREAEAATARLAAIVASSDDAIVSLKLDGIVTSWNRGAEKLFGYSTDEMLGQPIHRLISAGRVEEEEEILSRIRRGDRIEHYETVRRHKTGRLIDVSLTASPMTDSAGTVIGASKISRDVTERKRTEEQIQASLKEKEVLLREVHHRVKNNLQVIYSLLRLQSNSVTDPKALELFQDSQARVKAMALIHETLYQSQDLSRIDMAAYISNLTGQLFKSYGISPDTIRLRLNSTPVSLSIETAITCGLLINELVSNSLKYAFPNGRTGEVAIQLLPDGQGTHVLTISDNGVGLPSTFEVEKAKSLGWQLVPMLVEQLTGTFELDRSEGMSVKLTFSEPCYKGKV